MRRGRLSSERAPSGGTLIDWRGVPAWIGVSLSIGAMFIGGLVSIVNMTSTLNAVGLSTAANRAELGRVTGQLIALDKSLAELVVDYNSIKAEVDRRRSRLMAMELELGRLSERATRREQ